MVEQRCWAAFLEREFPSYERFWLRFVVPVTTRDTDRQNPRLKTNAELKAMTPPRIFFDVYLAELNYSVLWHLSSAYDMRHRPGPPDTEFERFTYFIIRICSALDVADELLERHQEGFTGSNPWGKAAERREVWRKANPDAYLQHLQRYRNQLIHSGAVMSIRNSNATLVPRIGRHRDYRDWRSLHGVSAAVRKRDFRPWERVADEAWLRTMRYLEQRWRWMLRQRRVRVRLPRSLGKGALTDAATTQAPILSGTYFSPEQLARRRSGQSPIP